MDTQYIEELKALEDKKDAKAKLIAYAAEVGAETKKTKSFDNIVLDIKAHFEALADEPMPEDNEGLSISDLIDADDELSGALAHVDGADEAKEEAKLLFDAPTVEAKAPALVEVKAVVRAEDKVEVVTSIEAPVGEVVTSIQTKSVEKADDTIFELPENFSPHLILIGRNPGYVTLPWWIYQWIKETPDWKSRPTSFVHGSAHQTLFSLIYYIKRNGSIMVRETRNSSFVTLK